MLLYIPEWNVTFFDQLNNKINDHIIYNVKFIIHCALTKIWKPFPGTNNPDYETLFFDFMAS